MDKMGTNEEILNFSQSYAEPDWLTKHRQAAFEASQTLELPHIERVNFRGWKLEEAQLAESPANGLVPDFTELPSHSLLVQVGTQTILEQTSPELAEKGLIFTDFYRALEEIPELVQKYFGTVIEPTEDLLAAVHYANFSSGAVLYVPDNVEITEPLEAIFQTNQADCVKHILIIASKNSKFSYLERLQTADGSKKIRANIQVEVIAEAGAQVKFAAIDQLGSNVTAFISRRGLIKDDASIDWSIGVLNDGNIICDFDSDLKGSSSHSQLKAVGISMGRQIQGVDTRVTNFGSHSVGHILQHGVILERGTLTFNGIGHIIKGAKGADAQQESRVLMLSDTARADANPILLIDENDVTAGHAASIGQVDPEDMYYLMSRGLDEAAARKLVIRGFLGSVVTEIPVKSVRDEFIATIDRKLDI